MIIALIVVAVCVLAVMLFLRQPSFGRLPAGKRKQRILASPQYRDGSFQNQSLTPQLTGGVSMLTVMRDFFFGKHAQKQPAGQLPAIKAELKEASGDLPQLTWFGHSSYLLQLEHFKLLADPVFSQRTSPVQYAGSKAFDGTGIYTAADMPDVDVLLITHDHYDHLDYHTVMQLKDRVGLIVTSLGVGAHLERWGIAADKIRELDWGESTEVRPGISLTATPARHFSGRGFKRNQTLWSSFVLHSARYRLFLGGDSGYDTHFKTIGAQYGPFDLAILECGQYNAYWAHIHMMPEETAQAAADLKARVLLPVHWGKFALATHPWNEPIQRVLRQADNLSIKTITPRIGETFRLESDRKYPAWWQEG